jgi:hypothetical protein
MSVRKRNWTTSSGEAKEAWVVDYIDQHGKRHLKTFARKRDADSHHATVTVEVKAGTHTADRESMTAAWNGRRRVWINTLFIRPFSAVSVHRAIARNENRIGKPATSRCVPYA